MNTKKKEIRKLILSIIAVSTFLIFMTTFVYLPKQENLLSSFAFLQNMKRFYMEDISSGILLKEAIPTQDKIGLEYDPYQFKVVNNSNSDITYQIVFKNNLEKIEAKGKEVLPNKYLRYSLNKQNKEVVPASTLSEDGLLYTTTVKAHSEDIYDFRMWLDWYSDNGAMNKVFIGKIEIIEIEK